MKEQIKDLAIKAKYPLIYACSFSALTGISEGIKTATGEGINSGIESMVNTAFHNLPFFAIVNTGYAKAVDIVTRKYGRIGANALCLTVNAGFVVYAYVTGDNDPTYQVAVTTAVGLALTNHQVSDIQR